MYYLRLIRCDLILEHRQNLVAVMMSPAKGDLLGIVPLVFNHFSLDQRTNCIQVILFHSAAHFHLDVLINEWAHAESSLSPGFIQIFLFDQGEVDEVL